MTTFPHRMLDPRNSARPLARSVFAFLGLRPVHAQHTAVEEELLAHHARGAKTAVEIGVAEGASAAVLRQAIDPAGTLHLIDPYRPGSLRINFAELVARRYVGRYPNARVVWLRDFSFNVSKAWREPIDFLFIDGDHRYDEVKRDWEEWSPFVQEGGLVAFHDARVFDGGWTQAGQGPVRLIDELFRSTPPSPGWRVVGEADSLVVVRRGARA